MTVLGHRVPVARLGHLIAMKLLARHDKLRPQDVVDLRALSQAADAAEWKRAATPVAMIEERGFARKRDLRGALARLRRDSIDERSTRRRAARRRDRDRR